MNYINKENNSIKIENNQIIQNNRRIMLDSLSSSKIILFIFNQLTEKCRLINLSPMR